MSDTCKHCGQNIRPYNAKFTNGWIHENETVGLWCHRTMAEPKEAADECR